MAFFARINESNIVQEVNVIDDDQIDGGIFPESEPLGQAYMAEIGFPPEWLQASPTGAYRDAYPSPGWEWQTDSSRADGGIFAMPTLEETP
jgi:hypothetical protein